MEATGFRYGNLGQVTTCNLVLTCHEIAPDVQCRLRAGMADTGDVVLRQRSCFECQAVFFLCSHCDHGQRYCSPACRQLARRRQQRAANRRHQQSPEGRDDHRDRQERYRQRHSVTDQGSLSTVSAALSRCGSEELSRAGTLQRSQTVLLEPESGMRLRCRICGRMGRLLDLFPRLRRWRRALFPGSREEET